MESTDGAPRIPAESTRGSSPPRVESNLAPLPPEREEARSYSSNPDHACPLDGERTELSNSRLDYWVRHSSGAPQLIQLPTDRSRSATRSYESGRLQLRVSSALTEQLRRNAQQQSVTLSEMLLSGWAVLLGRWSGQDDVVIGMRVTNHCPSGAQPLPSSCANTVAVHVRMQHDPTVENLLLRTQTALAEATAHAEVPFGQVAAVVNYERSQEPPIQVMFELNDSYVTVSDPDGPRQTNSNINQVMIESTNSKTPYELCLSLYECSAGLTGTLQYATDLFERETIEQMVACWEVLLDGMTGNIRVPISRLPILPAAERERVVQRLCSATARVSDDRLIHELFEEFARHTPNAKAIMHEDITLTYAELNARANRLARFLIARGVCPDEPVALCAERGVEMVIGMLGVLKAGGALVPLDPAYPADRLAYMLKDAAPRILLTQKTLIGIVPPTTQLIIAIDHDWDAIAEQDASDPAPNALGITSFNLAYIIYTSGSTGLPKGVMNEHRGMVNRILAQKEIVAFTDRDVCCQKTSISFVDAIFETLGPLCSGRLLLIIPRRVVNDSREMAALIAKQHVTCLVTVPSLARSMLNDAQIIRDLSGLRSWTLSGEELRAELLMQLHRQLPSCEFVNVYGTSEVSADASIYKSKHFSGDRVPIGRPLPNTTIIVLDPHHQPLPIGVVGEIYVGGVGVARGYLNRPELTAARFIADPFSSDPRARLYKTGDLGRWTAAGMLEYLGRSDHQVKIRGFRIELAEIEAQLLRDGQVREAVVVAREDTPGQKRLVAYVTLRDGNSGQPGTESLRSHLAAVLPDHMVPSALVVLDDLPLTPNGKLDRGALPAPKLDAYATRQYAVPCGETERILASIWQELLQVERVGREDNFFALGGHSLLIVQMLERLHAAGLFTQAPAIYASPTLSELASNLTRKTTDQIAAPPNLIPPGCETITPEMLPLVDLEPKHIKEIVRTVPLGAVNVQDIYPLTPLQEGMLFHHLFDEQGEDTYVEATLLSVSSRDRLEELISALQGVIDRHDILRTAVLWEQLPYPVQVVYRQTTLPVEEIALAPNRGLEEQFSEWIKPERLRLDLRHAPLMRLEVTRDPRRESWYALLQIHHMVNDDVSLKILISEVVAQLERRANNLPEPVPYRNQVALALAHARAHDSEAFFRDKLGDIEEPTAPFGMLNVRGRGSRIDEARENLDPTLASRVHVQARRLGVSAAILFHAAWGLVVARTSARHDVVFGTVLLGRLRGGESAKRIMGMFINTLPLRLRLENISARELVDQTRRELHALLNHEQASLAMAQRCSGIVGSDALFTAALNYQNSRRDPEREWASAPGIRALKYQYRTNYPLGLSVDDLGDGFALTAQTERHIDPRRLIAYMQTTIRSLVGALEQELQTPVLTLSILPESERHQVTQLFNRTLATYPGEKLLHELFEEQAERTPDAVALVAGNQSMTYADLNRRANQLARYLRRKGVGPDRLVAVCTERCVELFVGWIGVLKAGGAYLPLDPTNPIERLEFVLADAAPQALLTQSLLKDQLPHTTAEIIVLDSECRSIANQRDDNLEPGSMQLCPENLAYVIYTSGSTGEPKGVMVEHRNIVNYTLHVIRQFDVASGSGSVICTSISFDLMLTGLYPCLLCGKAVRLCPEHDGLPALTEELLKSSNLAPLKLTPSHLPLLEHALESGQLAGRVRVLVLGGEPLQWAAVQLWRRMAPDTRVFNHYGPTETTVGCIVNEVGEDVSGAVPIGRPISNTQVFILDSHMQVVPVGVAGDIYVGGAGVTRGYLNRPELTAERFIANPLSADPQARLYKTGDVGRWRSEGTVEFLGRSDHQVKIRGYRVELGEIENQLRQHSQVREALALVREDEPGDKRLVAYVVADTQQPLPEHGAYDAACAEMVAQWSRVYEETYSVSAPSLSFIGWDSSYTGQPIPEEQMQEWLACTVERISALKPTKVLEIGCGAGLVLQHVAPQCRVYVAVDFSASALAHLRRWMNGREDLKHVEVLQGAATDLQELQPGAFDTVVLNSVVQYFPDIGYLLAVIREAVRLLRPGGKIFIGDVRHLGLLSMFHSAVQFSKAAATITAEQLRKRVARALTQEKELLIDPQFFEALPGHLPGISAVDVQLKRGWAQNEMTRYRYDVVLRVNSSIEMRPVCERREWRAGDDFAADVEAALANHRWSAMCLTSIPNDRLTREAAAQELIATSAEQLEAGALRHQLNDLAVDGIDPETVWQWAAAYGYDISIAWGRDGPPGCLEIQLLDRTRLDQILYAPPPWLQNVTPWRAYANDPLENSRRQQLIPQLRDYLKERLPEYMIPAAWMLLKQLPLTPNGKVDRRALPAPHGRPEDAGEYVAPSTELERKLASIWAQVLHVDQVGMRDNFFDLGGHSLLAMQVVVRIRSLLSVDMPMRLLFECPTIELICPRVHELRRARLLDNITTGGADVEDLLQKVALMPESEVQELMGELVRRGLS